MDKLFDLIKHFTRDFFVYFLGGIILLCNLVYLDFNFKIGIFNHEIIKSNSIFLSIVGGYLLGQLATAITEWIIVDSKIDELIVKTWEYKQPDSLKEKEIEIFIKNREVYSYFIERYSDLFLMRWNIAGTLLIIFLTNFILFICSWSLSWQNQHNNSLLVIALGAFIISIAMFKLHYKATAEGYFSRINQGLEAINNAYTNKIEK